MSQPRFAVIGAGLAGSLMAINLGRLGYDVKLFERRSDPRATGGVEGRSINLAISTRGIHALSEVGVADAVLARAVPMPGRMVHSPEGKVAFLPYGTRPEHAINSVSRSELNITLLDAAAELPHVRLHFNQRIADIKIDEPCFTTRDDETNESRLVEADVVVGADGAFSAVREEMSRLDRFDFSQSYLAHGYKELTIPPVDGGFRLEKNALHIWPRVGYMMIALPNYDGSFTCTLFWPFEGPNSFANLQTREDVKQFFDDNFPDSVPHMPHLVDEYFQNPTNSLVTVRSGPWHHRGRVVLLGDACHAVVPFFGQGANAAFEDCSILKDSLTRHAPDWQAAFAEYYQKRKVHIDVLADLCLENFIEMRDHVASGSFRVMKRLEKVIQRLLPGWFLSLYSMVSFSRIPYGDAVRRARRQNMLVKLTIAGLLVLIAIVGVGAWT